MKNWWYYHKWYVICGIILCLAFFQIIGNAFGWIKKHPDVQIAYVGEAPLPEDTVSAIEKSFSSLAGDYNHDGEVLVKINQYASGNLSDQSAEAAQYRQAAELRLIADINDCESYFFLLDNPENFQKKYQILAMEDGSIPQDTDFSASDKVFAWKTSNILNTLELGNYQTTLLGQSTSGKNQDIVSALYLGRRYFYDSRTTENPKECAALWDKLKG